MGCSFHSFGQPIICLQPFFCKINAHLSRAEAEVVEAREGEVCIARARSLVEARPRLPTL